MDRKDENEFEELLPYRAVLRKPSEMAEKIIGEEEILVDDHVLDNIFSNCVGNNILIS